MQNSIDSFSQFKKQSEVLLRSNDAEMRKIKASIAELNARLSQAITARQSEIQEIQEIQKAIDSRKREIEAQLNECEARMRETSAVYEQAVADLMVNVRWIQSRLTGPAGHERNKA